MEVIKRGMADYLKKKKDSINKKVDQ